MTSGATGKVPAFRTYRKMLSQRASGNLAWIAAADLVADVRYVRLRFRCESGQAAINFFRILVYVAPPRYRTLAKQLAPMMVTEWIGRRPSHAWIVRKLDQPRNDHAHRPIREILLYIGSRHHWFLSLLQIHPNAFAHV
jgi:hypothetical protein